MATHLLLSEVRHRTVALGIDTVEKLLDFIIGRQQDCFQMIFRFLAVRVRVSLEKPVKECEQKGEAFIVRFEDREVFVVNL